MNLSKPPPIVTVGPWRNAEAMPPATPPKPELWWQGGGWDVLTGTFDALPDLFDLGEILFGLFRIVGHLIVGVLHAIFHI